MKLVCYLILASLVLASCDRRQFTPQNYVIVDECKILEADDGTVIFALPGLLCSYDKQGHAYAYTRGHLTKFSLQDKSVEWQVPARIHHSITYSSEGEVVYFLEGEVFTYKGERFGGVKIRSVNQRGEEGTFSWNSSNHIADFEAKLLLVPSSLAQKIPVFNDGKEEIEEQVSRFVSANQIEVLTRDHPLLGQLNQAQNGDLLLTLMDESSVILIDKLNGNIKNVIKVPNSVGQIHTVTYTKNSLLAFVNRTDLTRKTSQAVELSFPQMNEKLWAYPLSPSSAFYSKLLSSVQKVNENLYFVVDNSHNLESYLFINQNSEVLHRLPSSTSEIRSRKIYRATTLLRSQLNTWIGGPILRK